MRGQGIKDLQFDKILLDAPCSGTGTIRKSLKTISIWNAGMITKLAKEQKELIEVAFQNLRPGGEMVYSTCSLEPEENEGVVSHLLNKYENAEMVEVVLPGLKVSPPVMVFKKEKYHPSVKKVIRIWPQDNDTEGFFVAKIKNRIKAFINPKISKFSKKEIAYLEGCFSVPDLYGHVTRPAEIKLGSQDRHGKKSKKATRAYRPELSSMKLITLTESSLSTMYMPKTAKFLR